MEVAGGVIAVFSLGIQLAESVQKIRKFLRGVKEAPKELQRLIARIDLLDGIFNRVNALIEQQCDMPSHQGLIPLFKSALDTCQISVNKLESEMARVQGFSHDPDRALKNLPKGSLRKRHALCSVLRKETVDELCSVVDESLRNLDLVLHLNSTQLLLGNLALIRTLENHEHSIQTLNKGTTAESSTSEDGQQILMLQTQNSQASNELSMSGNPSTLSKYTRHSYRRKLWGYVQFQEEAEYTYDESKDQEQTIMQRWSTVFTLPFLRNFLEWQLLKSYGQVSRSLRHYPRLADPLLYYSSFRGSGDEDPLQNALASRELSPFAVDDDGWTLLHYASFFDNPDLCSMLVRLGVNPEQRDNDGNPPITKLFRAASTQSSDTARVLVNSQSDLEAADVQAFYKRYLGAPESAELVFSYDKDLSKMCDHQNFQITPLHLALLHFGGGGQNSLLHLGGSLDPGAWLYLVRKLLRGSVDLHAQCENLFVRGWRHQTSQLLTPLQCLLLGSHHPCDGEYAAKIWLALLGEAEYDQVDYLTHEMLLHAQNECMDFETWYPIPAGTRCFYGPRYHPITIMFVHLDPPRVWWDWFIEPECKAYHLLHEYRNFDIHYETQCTHFTWQDGMLIEVEEKWRHSWPFCYPDWSEESRPDRWADDQELNAWKQLFNKAWTRHARRAERPTRKLTRSQRRRASPLPGAWIE